MGTKSEELFAKACELFPGGVNSPVRAFKAVGGGPRFIARGEGPYLIDVDGKRYVDYVLSYGPLLHGHAHPSVLQAIADAAAAGTSFGMPTDKAIQLAELIQGFMPKIEMLRFVNSGTEATMSAIRLARAATEKQKIIKFSGCYHGHADPLLAKAGSGIATLGLPDSSGVPATATQNTLVANYNDTESVAVLVDKYKDDLAAIIVEPVAGNMGLVPPAEGFLQYLRDQCDQTGAILIFDEVMTGFRVDPTGAQGLYSVFPDLTTLGKVIGGGLPVGAYGGRRDLMDLVAPTGPMYQAGTLSGNPLAMAAGIACLELLRGENRFEKLNATGAMLDEGMQEAASEHGLDVAISRVGTMSGMYFLKEPPTNWDEVKQASTERFKTFFHAMLERGVFYAPSAFEAGFISTSHTEAEVELTLAAARESFRLVANQVAT